MTIEFEGDNWPEEMRAHPLDEQFLRTLGDEIDDWSERALKIAIEKLIPEVRRLRKALTEIAHHKNYKWGTCADPDDCPNCAAWLAIYGTQMKSSTTGGGK